MILVTGGAGYIGSHCVLELVKNGYNVTVFDNFSVGHPEIIDVLKNLSCNNLKFVKGDLTNYADILSAMKCKPKAVIHFAAFSQVGESVINPAKYYRNNVCGTVNLLNAMLEYEVKKIVFSSTAAVYGEPNRIPIDENHSKEPVNTYGKTKLMIENMLDDYDEAYGLKSVRFRYFNVIGADCNANIGEWHNPETHLIPNILKSVLYDNINLKIFGTDYNTPDGTCIRDYIDIYDLVSAHISGLNYLNKYNKSNVFNLGTKHGYTVKQILDTCANVTGKKITPEYTDRRTGDPEALVADNTKAKNVLNWIPKVTLSDSIKNAYIWEQKLKDSILSDKS